MARIHDGTVYTDGCEPTRRNVRRGPTGADTETSSRLTLARQGGCPEALVEREAGCKPGEIPLSPGISAKWKEQARRYERFARRWHPAADLDFSPEAAEAMYRYETFGEGDAPGIFGGKHNGYMVGKHCVNLQVAMWKEALAEGLITKQELYADEDLEHPWVEEIVKDMVVNRRGVGIWMV